MIWVDVFEPKEILPLLSQSVTVSQISLNHQGFADYMWTDVQNNIRQWERKQFIECVSDLDAVEEQLNHHLNYCQELTLVIENVGVSTAQGVQEYRRKGVFFTGQYQFPDPKLIKLGRARPQPGLWSKFEAWKSGLRAQGVLVVETTELEHTASALVAAYNGSMREERTTLQRYLTPHIPPFHPDIHVDNLARLKGTRVGIERAKQAITKYGTVYGVLTADREGLETLWGKAVTKSFLEGIGRE
jgi:hypothetical protein